MPTFIDAYLRHTKHYESPGAFWKWSAYATIAAVLRDSCYKRSGDSYLYPNIYVLLLADSSGHRKGRPIDTCETMVHKVSNTKVVGGSTSIQALIDELAHTETDPRTGKVKKSGAGIFIAQEFSAALVEDPRAVKVLTDIYDYKPIGYTVRLISRAASKIDKLVLSFFGASNQAMLKDLFDQTAIYGGLLARTFLVMPDEFRDGNSLWDTPEQQAKRDSSFKNLIERLHKIAELSGEFVFTDEAQKEYDSWYIPFRKDYLKKTDRSGILGRIHTGVLKIAMILAANELTLCVTKKHIEQAIEVCLSLLPNYNVFIMTHMGNSTIKEAGATILQELLNAQDHRLSRKVLLRDHWREFDADLLDKVIVSLAGGGLLTELTVSSDIFYQLTPKCLEVMGNTQT